jgi:hypothetical protein
MCAHWLETEPMEYHPKFYSLRVIVGQRCCRSGQSGKIMPNPSFIVGHSFKDYGGILFVAFELSMACGKTFLPTLMHTIDRTKYNWKSTILVELKIPCRISLIGCSKMNLAEHLHHCNGKVLDTLDSLALSYRQMVIN